MVNLVKDFELPVTFLLICVGPLRDISDPALRARNFCWGDTWWISQVDNNEHSKDLVMVCLCFLAGIELTVKLPTFKDKTL